MSQVSPTFPLDFTIERIEAGYRLITPSEPAGSIEARTFDELIGKLVRVVWRTLEDAERGTELSQAEEELALRKLSTTSLDRRALEALASRNPAPREWGEEPDWSDAL